MADEKLTPQKRLPTRDNWHLGREVPLALIATLIIMFVAQTISAVWWVSNTSVRLSTLENHIAAIASRGERLASVEAKVGFVAEAIQRIEQILNSRRRSQ